MKQAIVFEARRDAYSIGQLEGNYRTMTVGELRELLEDFEDNDLVVLSHDSGYTYGSLSYPRHYEKSDSGEWEEM